MAARLIGNVPGGVSFDVTKAANIGVIGGAYDVIYMKKINEYAELKYRRRFYNKMVEAQKIEE